MIARRLQVVLEGFGTGHHGCCLEKLTRKAACKTSVLPRVITIMSFDFSSRFLYTLEAPFRTFFFLFVAFTLFFFFDISGSDKQPSFVLFRSQFQFFIPEFFSRPESAQANYRRIASIRFIIGWGSQAWGSQRSFSSKPHRHSRQGPEDSSTSAPLS